MIPRTPSAAESSPRHPRANGRRHRAPPVRRANEHDVVFREVKSLNRLDRAELLAVALWLRLVAALVEVAVVGRLGLDLEERRARLLRDRLRREARVAAPREVHYGNLSSRHGCFPRSVRSTCRRLFRAAQSERDNARGRTHYLNEFFSVHFRFSFWFVLDVISRKVRKVRKVVISEIVHNTLDSVLQRWHAKVDDISKPLIQETQIG